MDGRLFKTTLVTNQLNSIIGVFMLMLYDLKSGSKKGPVLMVDLYITNR